jgi:hypothetical protein
MIAGGWMVDGAADDHRPDTVRTKPLKSNAGTVADDTNIGQLNDAGG